MDYLDENAPAPAASSAPVREGETPDLELDTDVGVPTAVEDAASNVDPFLRELLPEDRNARRRVVTALLRAVLAERKIT